MIGTADSLAEQEEDWDCLLFLLLIFCSVVMIGYDDFILPCFGSKLIRVCDWVPIVQTIPFLATSMELGHVPFRIEYSFTYGVSIWVELLSRNLCKNIITFS